MSNSRAAYRYALAILGVAEELKQLDRVGEDFVVLEKLITDSKEFYLFLKSPVINIEKKKSVLAETLKGRVCETTAKFVHLITVKGRENILPEIIRQFVQLRDERMGILRVAVRTAVAFTPQQEQQLIDQLKKVTGKDIRLSFVIDATVVGGFTAQYEDTVWDGSVSHQLEILRKRFTSEAA